jgi:hypothetical protein
MIVLATDWFEVFKATNKSTTSIQYLFHNTWLAQNITCNLNVLSLKMGVISNVSSTKILYKTVRALKPNQLQFTNSIAQANASFEWVHKVVRYQ